MILLPVIEIPVRLRGGDGQEPMLELDRGISDKCEPRLESDQLTELGANPLRVPMVREMTMRLCKVLIEFEVCVADNSVPFLTVGEDIEELFDMSVAGVINEEKEGFDMTAFRCGFDPAQGRWRLRKDDVNSTDCLGELT